MEAAAKLFGSRRIFYSSDFRQLRSFYHGARKYIGGRIHGFVAAVVEGATAHLIYHTDKAVCAKVIVDRLHLNASARVSIIEEEKQIMDWPGLVAPKRDVLARKIEKEAILWRKACMKSPTLRAMMKLEDGA